MNTMQPDSVYISFIGPIHTNSVQNLLGTIANIRAANSNLKEIHLLLSTGGGSVSDGITLFNVLKSFPVELFTYNMGKVDSIGNVVFLAGKKRCTLSTASFMFHGISFTCPALTSFNEKGLEEKLEAIKSDQNLISDIIAANTALKTAEINKFFLREAILGADEAKKRGLVQKVVSQIQIPPTAGFVQLMIQ